MKKDLKNTSNGDTKLSIALFISLISFEIKK